MMKNTVFYTKEKNNIAFIILLLMGFFSLGYFTYLKITDPEIWSPNGFFIAFICLLIFNFITILLTYFNYTSRKKFSLKRDQILKNGLVVEGKIINITHNISTLTQSDGDTYFVYHYFALVTYDDGNEEVQYWTPELAFHPKKLTSNKVKVHLYNNEFYVDGFQLGEYNEDCNILQKGSNSEDRIANISHKMTYLFQIILVFLFIVICTLLILKISNIFARIIFIPFILCGIAVMLSGTLHLVKNNKRNSKITKINQKIDSLTKKIFLVGASIFWFGLLIVADYSFIQEGNIQMFLFSLIFWGAGIYVIYGNWKNS